MNYFTNLLSALMGIDPYRMELDRVKEEYEKTAERVRVLDEMKDDAALKKAEFDELTDTLYVKISDAEKLITEKQKQVASLQELVEDLRLHLDEKERQIDQMVEEHKARREGYDRRLAEYGEQVSRLQAELAKARKRNKAAAKKHADKKVDEQAESQEAK